MKTFFPFSLGSKYIFVAPYLMETRQEAVIPREKIKQ